ncbi:MAG: hypothetical protein LC772_02525 [Chloroflexi bacterium]|nr:hypothetical protein [Chloroflexota bacterium]
MTKSIRFLIPLAALLLSGGAAFANSSVSIQDQAGVLSANDKQAITQTAQSAPFGVVVWTVNGGYANNKPGFLNALHGYVGSDTVGIGLDTADRFAEVTARQNTGLSPDDSHAAKASADQHFGSHDWAGGIQAAITSLASAASARPASGSYTQGNYAPRTVYNSNPVNVPSYSQGYQSSGGGFGFGSIFMLFIFIVIISMIARRLMGGGRRYYGPGGYGPSGYGPGGYGGYGAGGMGGMGYGPGYNQGGNGLLAGGLGALGGGVLGYELGRNAGERENGGQFIQQGGQDWGNSGNSGGPGGFSDSDSGAGNAPDFGGGGGGADFGGGGGGADFGGGGGGDMGGGGGGTDF